MNDLIYEGKSKLVYQGMEESTVIIKYKDTATAFNGEKKEELVGKGRLNAEISGIIYEYLEKNGVQTHFVRRIDDITMEAKKAEIVKVEVIVRNLAAGSFSKKYGIDEGTPLGNVVVEFSYKSDEFGDPLMCESQITAIGLASQAELDVMREQAVVINLLLSSLFEKCDMTLVDFKLEFGRIHLEDGNRQLILCDEISPDSCRLWDANTGKKMDKDRFRQGMGEVLGGYEEVLRRLNDAVV